MKNLTGRVKAAGIAAHVGKLEKALHSIASNTCCSNCREASLVARAALASYAGLAVEMTEPDDDLKSNPFIPGTDLSEAYEKGWSDALHMKRGYSLPGHDETMQNLDALKVRR